LPKTLDSLSSENREQRNRVHDLCRQYNRAPSNGHLKKLKQAFLACGDDVFIEQGFVCDYGDKISLGDRVYININCTCLDGGNIVIGDDVLIGPNVQLITVNHPLKPSERLLRTNLVEDLIIGDNVWIGAGAILLPGIKVADGCVIAAGSIVTKNLEANCLYAGNPAVKIRRLE